MTTFNDSLRKRSRSIPIKGICTYQDKRYKLQVSLCRGKRTLKKCSYALVMAMLLVFFVALILPGSPFFDGFLPQQLSAQYSKEQDLGKAPNSSEMFIEGDKAQSMQAQLSALKMHNALRFVPSHRHASEAPALFNQTSTAMDSDAKVLRQPVLQRTVLQNNVAQTQATHAKQHKIMLSPKNILDARDDIEQKIALWEARFQSKIKTPDPSAG